MRPTAYPNQNDSPIVRRSFAGQVSFVVALAVWFGSPAIGQQVQSGVSSGTVNIPQTNLVPITTPPGNFGSPSGGFSQFDPYATNPSAGLGSGTPFGSGTAIGSGLGSGTIPAPTLGTNSGGGSGVTVIGPPSATTLPPPQNSIAPSPTGGSLFSRMFSRPASAPVYGTPPQGTVFGESSVYGNAPPISSGVFDAPSIYAPQPGYAPPPATVFPDTAYPSAVPSSLFPEGLFSGGVIGAETFSAFRLFQGPRLRHGYVSPGSKPAFLGMNDTDTSVVFAFPNFLYSSQPILVIPSFSLHLWDGPDGSTGADLPSNAYSAFLDMGWESDPNKMFATEFGVRVGVFTDFDTYNSKSLRVLGKALASFRLTPTSTFKGGVYYLDRNSVKLVPAFGFLCRPNPFTRFDIFFPQPKFSRYCRTVGTRDVWWYISGDYGGGSWTIKRTDQTEDSVDINDYRAIFGLEWGTSDQIQMGRRTAFLEVGYVFEREVEYRYNPQDNFKPDSGVMFRAGIGY